MTPKNTTSSPTRENGLRPSKSKTLQDKIEKLGRLEKRLDKWRVDQTKKKLMVLYIYIPAMALIFATIALWSINSPLAPFTLVVAIALYGGFILYGYRAFWRKNLELTKLEKEFNKLTGDRQ